MTPGFHFADDDDIRALTRPPHLPVRVELEPHSTAASLRRSLALELGLIPEAALPTIVDALGRTSASPLVLVTHFGVLANTSMREMRAVSALLRELARLVAVHQGSVFVAERRLKPQERKPEGASR